PAPARGAPEGIGAGKVDVTSPLRVTHNAPAACCPAMTAPGPPTTIVPALVIVTDEPTFVPGVASFGTSTSVGSCLPLQPACGFLKIATAPVSPSAPGPPTAIVLPSGLAPMPLRPNLSPSTGNGSSSVERFTSASA